MIAGIEDNGAAGRVTELWRYPVSSIGGERLEIAEIDQYGVTGDRLYGLFDADSGQVAAPEKETRWRPALFLSARIGSSGQVDLRFPEVDWISISDISVTERLTEHFGFEVGIGRYGDHSAGSEPKVSPRYVASPLHIVTTASIRTLEQMTGEISVDPRRFRPNILIETFGEAFPEKKWLGHKLQIGSVCSRVIEETKRCGMTLIAQPGIEERPEVLRGILRHNRRNLGVYGDIEMPGVVRIGDRVYFTS
ncbi:MOSC domain-containing protein [Aliirhizobium smilacinae]|nr:MOSC domain-containing protein [Rhizobium smilacinae]